MKTRYYNFGGQPIPHAYRWKGFPSNSTRIAAETRGLSGDSFGHGQEASYLPYRASGPEPLDPGETGTPGSSPVGDAADGLGAIDLKDPKTLGMIALVGLGAWFLFGRKTMRKNPSRKGSQYVSTYCNFPHSKKTGRPIGHECRIIPPSALRAEMAGDYDKAIEIMSGSRRQVVKGK